MKRILSVFLLIAMTVSTFAILPAQAAAPITSTEEDSIVPSPWDSIETEGGAFSFEIEEAGLTYAAQGAETYGARSSSLPFRDVSSSSWFYDEVVYVYEAGLMDGISSTEFAPNASLTRAEVVTVHAFQESHGHGLAFSPYSCKGFHSPMNSYRNLIRRLHRSSRQVGTSRQYFSGCSLLHLQL